MIVMIEIWLDVPEANKVKVLLFNILGFKYVYAYTYIHV